MSRCIREQKLPQVYLYGAWLTQGTPKPSQDVRSIAIAESKGSADAKQAAESAQRRIDIAAEATKRLAEVRAEAPHEPPVDLPLRVLVC